MAESGTRHVAPFWRTVCVRGCQRAAGGLGVKPPSQTKAHQSGVLHRGSERVAVRPDHTIVASTGGFLETLALHHVGPIMVPEWIGAPRQVRGELVRLLPEWEGAGLPLWIVWPRHNFQSAAARMFLEWVVEQSR
ncbi:MAG: LysR family transcriptional regulator for bpeEF and oprC [Myxococcota bacterium]|jgi:LysR family transcriptional regulator for bpeEF and oprC